MNEYSTPSYPHSLRQVLKALAAVALGAALQLAPTFASAQTSHQITPASGSWFYFYGQLVGTVSTSQPILIDYLGSTSMTIDITASGPFGFTHNCPIPPATLAYGGQVSCEVDVTFNPIGVGSSQIGTLNVATNDGPAEAINLSGDAGYVLGAVSDLSPSSLDFGSQALVTQSVPQTVVVTNVGTDRFYVQSIGSDNPIEFPVTYDLFGGGLAPPPDQPKDSPETRGYGANPAATGQGRIEVALAAKNAKSSFFGQCYLGIPLAAGDACSFDVAFIPYAPGRKLSVISVGTYNSSTESPATGVTWLLATGIGASGSTIDVKPSNIDFGDVILNQTSAPKAFSISSTGTNTITISDISVGPTTAGKSAIARKVLTDFTLQHECTTLAPGSSCTGKVSFRPSAIGARNASMVVKGDFDGSPLSIPLTGNGLPAPVPGLTLSVSSIGFGQRGYGDQSGTQQLTLTSSGVLPVTIASIYTLGDFFNTSTCPVVLNPGQSCTVTVGFKPSLFGTRNGELVVVSNAPDSPQSVQLQGTGCTPSVGTSFLALRGGVPVCPH